MSETSGEENLDPALLEILDRNIEEQRERLVKVREFLSYLAGFPLSSDVPENTKPINEFDNNMGYLDYAYARWEQLRNLRPSPDRQPTPKTDFLNERDPNVGWKFHLNVLSDDLSEADSYLMNERYDYKYLAGPHGGKLPPTAKIFTIYIGSFSKALELAPVLSGELASVLKKPDVPGEIEFAPGIAGRFNARDDRFTEYGSLGIQLLVSDRDRLKEYGIEEPCPPEYQERIELQALRILTNEQYGYGKYFFDLGLL